MQHMHFYEGGRVVFETTAVFQTRCFIIRQDISRNALGKTKEDFSDIIVIMIIIVLISRHALHKGRILLKHHKNHPHHR